MPRTPPPPPEINLSYRHDLPQNSGARQGYSVLAAPEHGDHVLRFAREVLDIKPSALGRLVGKAHGNAYHWFDGRSLPSQVYWVRIAYLLALKEKLRKNGASLDLVRTIDWSQPPYRIEWWPGAEIGLRVDSFGNRLETPSKEVQTLRETWYCDLPHPDDAPAAE